MSNTSFILEIGCEEIPARFVTVMAQQLKENVCQLLDDLMISYDKETVVSYSTYRRFTVSISSIKLMQSDRVVEMMGPPVAIAKDKQGKWTVPAQKFAEKCQCELSELTIKADQKNRDCLFFERQEKGRDTFLVLTETLPQIFQKFHLPIAMKWGAGEHVFIRPVHWVLALLGETVIPITLFDKEAGSVSQGHRILTRCAPVEISNAATYSDQLRTAKVIVDPEERKSIILSKLTQYSTEYDKDLLEEVINLVEYPTMLEGELDQKYLILPQDVIIETMKKHQKYFPLYDGTRLKNTFLIAADNVSDKNKSTIIAGNERVLRARLEDALFFWQEDLNRPLLENTEKLKQVIYQKELGTIFDKKERLKQLSIFLNTTYQLGLNEADISLAADLCKSDLVSSMVFEFPSLQGKMGALYAQHQGASESIFVAISDHYLPLQTGGDLPKDVLSAVLGLSDRIDHIVASYVSDQIPTGSKDPLGIRRAIYTALEIGVAFEWNINFSEVFTYAFSLYGKEKNRTELDTFFFQRLRPFLKEFNLQADEVDSILDQTYVSLLHFRKVSALFDLRTTPDYKVMVETAVRVKRLAQKLEGEARVDECLFTQEIEKEVWAVFKARSESDFFALNTVMSRYFDSVLVMDKDAAIRHNRLSQLSLIHQWYSSFADFEQIKGGVAHE